MPRPHRKYGTDTKPVAVRLTPEELKMLEYLTRIAGKKSQSDVMRACIEIVYELRNYEAVEGLFEQIMRGE